MEIQFRMSKGYKKKLGYSCVKHPDRGHLIHSPNCLLVKPDLRY